LVPFSRDGNKFITWLGVIIFSLWLLWDVDFLLNQSEKINDWNSATQIAYFLYVDIVNLILYLVEAYAE
jgi:FtsH-binding integral membrane protein